MRASHNKVFLSAGEPCSGAWGGATHKQESKCQQMATSKNETFTRPNFTSPNSCSKSYPASDPQNQTDTNHPFQNHVPAFFSKLTHTQILNPSSRKKNYIHDIPKIPKNLESAESHPARLSSSHNYLAIVYFPPQEYS